LKKDVWYEWIVKLKYNFGLFVVLKGGKVEGLLHKSKIKVPDGIRWKDLYQIWDKIKVKVYDLSKATQDGKNVQFTQV
jgi:ribosomal protein S1